MKPPGTVPGDQGGEPRRPQVGDTVEWLCDPEKTWKPVTVSRIHSHLFFFERFGGEYGLNYDGEGASWRWPATQGAAVAGPAIPHRCAEDECAEDARGPQMYCPTHALEAYALACISIGALAEALGCSIEDAQERSAANVRDCASPPPPASEPPVLESSHCPYGYDHRSFCTRCHADETTAAKAALEVQLAAANEALANMTEERDMQQFHARDVATERDALAAQLAGVGRVLESVQAHAERTLGATTAEKDRALDWICGQAKRARAALAASGPVKEGE